MFQGPYIDNGHGTLYETKHPSPRGCRSDNHGEPHWRSYCSLELLAQLT